MDDVLKQRLIGAAVLIAFGVIFIPMFFSDPIDPSLERTVDPTMPSSPMADREVRRIPLNPSNQRTDEPDPAAPVVTLPPTDDRAEAVTTERLALTESQPAPDEPSTEVVTEVEEDRTDLMTAAPAEVTEEPQVTEPSVAVTIAANDTQALEQQWRVQVASFGSEATASQVAETLRSLGHQVHVDRLVRGQSVLNRIQTGPYAQQAQAEAARVAIEQAVSGVSPVVKAPEDVDRSGQTVEPGYAVQVGSFTNAENAERLVSQLISQGFSAFWVVETVGGRSIWRVRVGTVPNRAEAEALQDTLRSEASLEGLVVSHP